MPRKVVIRRSEFYTDVNKLEQIVKDFYKELLKEHLEDLEDVADTIERNAIEVVPIDKGKLKKSINVRVSKSYRYPGIIAQASAKKRGFDYALIQEENEEFSHTAVDEFGKDREYEGMAHYLGGPFASNLYYLLEDLGVDYIEFPDELEHAKDYYEERT